MLHSVLYHLVALVPAHLLNLGAMLWPDLSCAIKRKFIHSCLHSNKWPGILSQLFFCTCTCTAKKTPPNCSSVAGCLPVSGRHVRKVHVIPLMSPTGPVYTAKAVALVWTPALDLTRGLLGAPLSSHVPQGQRWSGGLAAHRTSQIICWFSHRLK